MPHRIHTKGVGPLQHGKGVSMQGVGVEETSAQGGNHACCQQCDVTASHFVSDVTAGADRQQHTAMHAGSQQQYAGDRKIAQQNAHYRHVAASICITLLATCMYCVYIASNLHTPATSCLNINAHMLDMASSELHTNCWTRPLATLVALDTKSTRMPL